MSNRALHLLLALALSSAGCLGSALTGTGNGGGAGNGGGGGAGTGGGGNGGGAPVDMAPDVVAQFYANVAPIITPACGGCHGVAGGAGPAFMMAMPDMLQNLLSYPGIIGATPESSRLYAKGQHEGPAFTPAQAPIVHDWIALYDSLRPVSDGGVAKPIIAPFAPSMSATSTIDLSALDPTLAGQKLTFTAKMLGTSIQLSNIKVVAAASMGIRVAHPLFVMWDQNLTPTPDPLDSMSNVDETVFAGQTAPLGPGTLVLPSFPTNGLINVVFTIIQTKTGSADGGTVTGCKSVTSFTSNASPQFTGTGGILNCKNCHGAQGNAAANVWNLISLGSDDATTCAGSLSEISTATPTNSNLFKKVDPNSGLTHQGGKLTAAQLTTFETAVTTWINAEK
jgi:cytochrome c553